MASPDDSGFDALEEAAILLDVLASAQWLQSELPKQSELAKSEGVKQEEMKQEEVALDLDLAMSSDGSDDVTESRWYAKQNEEQEKASHVVSDGYEIVEEMKEEVAVHPPAPPPAPRPPWRCQSSASSSSTWAGTGGETWPKSWVRRYAADLRGYEQSGKGAWGRRRKQDADGASHNASSSLACRIARNLRRAAERTDRERQAAERE